MMGSLQPQSHKIKKRVKNNLADPQNFVCGGCGKAYKFYPGLYLHIKSKHEGIRPPGTTIIRPERSMSDIDAKPGRPRKGEKDIDEIDEVEACIETCHNDLMRFIGEKLEIMKTLCPKASLEAIGMEVLEVCGTNTDKWLQDLAEESKTFLTEYKEKDRKMQNLDFDDEFVHLDKKKSLKVIVWFMMWLSKIHVKPEFIPDLCVICSRIWKVVEDTDIEVQDLDNKLVWKKITLNCEGLMSRLRAFKNDTGLLTEFIRRVCQLIGKVFEEDSA